MTHNNGLARVALVFLSTFAFWATLASDWAFNVGVLGVLLFRVLQASSLGADKRLGRWLLVSLISDALMAVFVAAGIWMYMRWRIPTFAFGAAVAAAVEVVGLRRDANRPIWVIGSVAAVVAGVLLDAWLRSRALSIGTGADSMATSILKARPWAVAIIVGLVRACTTALALGKPSPAAPRLRENPHGG